ncbi:MAG: DUF350 domain-containing protein [Desulfobacterales bacterium]|nr:DUF350 domain-containing protein [Desulfobacterales bacterium]MCP4159419.1 DUF350 domain-containing protein [Deltaproteobacteria bacterium]
MEIFKEFTVEIVYIVLAILILLVGKVTLNILTPYKIDDELTAKDNPAFGISITGYYLGILIIFIGASIGEFKTDEIWSSTMYFEILKDFGWAMVGIVLLNFSRLFVDKLIFSKFSTRKEIIEDRNAGMGASEFGVYIASALILAGAISGDGTATGLGKMGNFITVPAFFLLGIAGFIISGWVYQLITKYDFHKEIEADNVAAGVAYGGKCIAIGIIMMKAVSGDFVSWEENLMQFGWYFFCSIFLIIAGRIAIGLVLMPKSDTYKEIVEDRNLNAGLLEGGIVAGLAAVISILL